MRHLPLYPPAKHRLFITFCIAVFFVLAFLSAQNLVAQNPMENTDFFTFWAGGRVVQEGRNPFNQAVWEAVHQEAGSTWMDNPTFVYPLPTALLFVPLAMLPVSQAAILWLVLTECLIVGAAALTLKAIRWKRSLRFLPFILLGVIFFRPTILTLWNGQLSGLLLFLFAAALFCWAHERWFWGGMFAGLLVLKPTGALVLLPAVALWLAARREWRGLAGMGGALVLLCGLASLVQPTWLPEWLVIGQTKVTWTFGRTFPPTLWGWAARMTDLADGWAVWAAIATVLAVLIGLWAVYRVHRADQWLMILGVVTPLSMVATPYLWNYDQILLILPILAGMAFLDQTGVPFAITALFPIFVDLAAIGLLILAFQLGHDAWSWLLPAGVAVVILIIYRRVRDSIRPAEDHLS